MKQKRFVTYIYQYEREIRGKNVGFIKTDIRDSGCRMEVQLRGLERFQGRGKIYLIVSDNDWTAIDAGEILIGQGMGHTQLQFPHNLLPDSNYTVHQIQAVIVRYGGGKLLVSCWVDEIPEAVLCGHFHCQEPLSASRKEMPDGSQTTPSAPPSTPDSSQPMPDTPQTAPSASRSTPSSSQTTPSVPRSMPSSFQTAPINTQPTPDGSQPMSDNSQIAPSVPRSTPNSSQSTPDGSQTVPDNPQTAPISTQPMSDTSQTAPINTRPMPDSSQIAPDGRQPAPDSTQTAPSSFQSAPDDSQPVPDTPQTAPSSSRPTPSNTRPAPEPTTSTTSFLSKQTWEVPVLTPDLTYQPKILQDASIPNGLKAAECPCQKEQSDSIPQPQPKTLPTPQVSFRKIEITDIRNLPKRNWHLCNNSFLIHGFFNYHYLIQKIVETDGETKCYLGVPGIFEQPERMMALLFGFPEFEPADTQSQQPNTFSGVFGYWMCQLDMD